MLKKLNFLAIVMLFIITLANAQQQLKMTLVGFYNLKIFTTPLTTLTKTMRSFSPTAKTPGILKNM